MSMMHEITAAVPRNKRNRRKGRGESSGHGKTSGRGTKGAGAHGGDVAWKPGHEGGQTSIFRRFPKRGFSNDNFERRFYVVNAGELNRFDNGATVDSAALAEEGLVPDGKLPVKILGEGKLEKKLTVTAGWYSKGAHQKITDAGGTVLNLKGEAFVFPKPKKKFVPRDPVKKAKKGEEAAPAAPAEAPSAPAPQA